MVRLSVIIRDDGTADYPVTLEVLRAVASDEHLKRLVIRFMAENFREDVKKAAGVALARIELRWDGGLRGFSGSARGRRSYRTSCSGRGPRTTPTIIGPIRSPA